MLDAITFDLGSVRSPVFVFSDASGLAPLTLPDEFLREQRQPPPEPQPDSVRRFETAMSAGPQLSPSVVESVMARMIPESRKVESRNPEVAAIANPVTVVPVDRPTVETPDAIVHEGSVVRSGDEKPVVASPEQPRIQVIATTPEERTVIAEKAPTLSVDKPVASAVEVPKTVALEGPVIPAVEVPKVVAVERPVIPAVEVPKTVAVERPVIPAVEVPKVVAVERPVIPAVEVPKVVAVERSVIPAVEAPKVVAVERPVVAASDNPTAGSMGRPVVAAVDKPVISVAERSAVVAVAKERPEAGISTLIASAVPAAKPVAEVEMSVVVDKPIDASGERPVRVAVEAPSVALANTTMQAGSVVRSAAERPVVEFPEQPAIQAIATTPEESIVILKEPPIISADKPVAAAVEAPKVVTVERPVVVTTDNPTIVTIERPVVPLPAHIVTPAVVENLNSRVAVKEQLEAPSVIPATPTAPSAKTVVMVEMPVAVDKPVVASTEQTKEQVVAATSAEPTVLIEKTFVQSADKPIVSVAEKPAAATVEVPRVATVDKPVTVVPLSAPTVVPLSESTVVSPSAPTVVPLSEPTVVSPSAPTVVPLSEPTVVPVVLENPVNRVKTEEPPVAARSTLISPDASAAKPIPRVEAPVAVDKPMGVSVVRVTSAEPAVAIEKTPVVLAERPVAAKVDDPSVVIDDKPDEKAVAASAHVVVAPAAVGAPVPQGVPVAPEVAAVSAASARTEALVETVNQVVEAVVGQILVTPGITQGDCEIKIMLKPTVLDGSEVSLSAKDGTLTVGITPSTQEASIAAAAALPRLEIALAEHAPAFHHVSVALQLKKGNRNEAV